VSWNPFLRWPRAALAVTAVLAVPLMLEWARFQVAAETRTLLAGDERNLSSYEKAREVLAGTELVLVSLEHEALFSGPGIEAVRRVSDALEQLPGVSDVKSLTHSVRPVRRGLGFAMVPFVPAGPLSAEALSELQEFARTHPLVRNVMVSADGRHTLITVTLPDPPATAEAASALRAQIDGVLSPFRAEGMRFTVLALPLVEEEIRGTLRRDLWRFVPAAAGLLLAILWLSFRSWRLLLLVLSNQAALLLVLPGAIRLTGFSFNIFSVMLVPLLAGIQLTLLTHLFSAYQRAVATGVGTHAALASALGIVVKPALFATLTTVVGLLSLLIGGVRPTAEFGLMGALGLCLVHGITFGPGLALLKLAGGSEAASLAPRGTTVWSGGGAAAPSEWPNRWLAWVQGRRAWLWILGAAVLAATGLGLRQVRTDIRAVEFLNHSSPTRQAIEHLDRVYGGINVVQVEFDAGRAGGVNNLAFLRYLEGVQREAERRPEFTGVYSYAQLLAMMNQIWEGERSGALRLPDQPWLIQLFVLALRHYQFPFLTALADSDQQTAYLVLRTSDMPADRYLALIQDIVRSAEAGCPAGVSVSAARGLHTILEADRRILRNQLGSAGLTFGVIGVVLVMLWRSPGLAAVALVANALPVALVIALAGFMRVPLNSITVMVAAVALGIAVDNAIHFITHWRSERRGGASPAVAVARTLRVKGRPIAWATAILVAVFGVFWCSSFPPVVHFGLLSAAAFLGGLGGVLVFLPAVLSGRDRLDKETPDAS